MGKRRGPYRDERRRTILGPRSGRTLKKCLNYQECDNEIMSLGAHHRMCNSCCEMPGDYSLTLPPGSIR